MNDGKLEHTQGRARICVCVSIALAILLGAHGDALADTVLPDEEGFYIVGEPYEVHSWALNFILSSARSRGSITQMQFRIVPFPDQEFESPGFIVSPNPSWHEAGNTGEILWATGTGATTSYTTKMGVLTDGYEFALSFANGSGAWGAPPYFTLQMQAYAGNTRVANQYYAFHSGGVTHSVSTSGWALTSPIPEPVTMLGVFAGVAGTAGYVRRRRLAG